MQAKLNHFLTYMVSFNLNNKKVGYLVCPPATQSSPCICDTFNSTGLGIYCHEHNLNEQQMSSVLNAFLLIFYRQSVQWSLLMPVAITTISSQISYNFTQLSCINLSQNQIISIPTGEFNFSKSSSSYILKSI